MVMLCYPGGAGDGVVVRERLTEVYVRDRSNLHEMECCQWNLTASAVRGGTPHCQVERMLASSRTVPQWSTCWDVCAARNCFQYLPSAVSLSVRAGNCLTASLRYSAGSNSIDCQTGRPIAGDCHSQLHIGVASRILQRFINAW